MSQQEPGETPRPQCSIFKEKNTETAVSILHNKGMGLSILYHHQLEA
jgi:hypothetical protein